MITLLQTSVVTIRPPSPLLPSTAGRRMAGFLALKETDFYIFCLQNLLPPTLVSFQTAILSGVRGQSFAFGFLLTLSLSLLTWGLD